MENPIVWRRNPMHPKTSIVGGIIQDQEFFINHTAVDVFVVLPPCFFKLKGHLNFSHTSDPQEARDMAWRYYQENLTEIMREYIKTARDVELEKKALIPVYERIMEGGLEELERYLHNA